MPLATESNERIRLVCVLFEFILQKILPLRQSQDTRLPTYFLLGNQPWFCEISIKIGHEKLKNVLINTSMKSNVHVCDQMSTIFD